MSQDPNARPMSSGNQRQRPLAAAMDDTEQRLSRSESVLLLGAFLTLAASMASFVTL